MKRNRQRRVLILLAAAALCLVMARAAYGGQRPGTGRLTLWFSLADCPQNAMEDLLARCYEENGIYIEATAYRDEQALGAAFEGGRPDLLFCSHTRAARLGGLVELASPLPVPEKLAEIEPAPGASFFPIGSRLPLLLVNTAEAGETFDTLEALLDAARTDTPFLVGDCWAELLYTACASLGEGVTGALSQDAESETWAALYNRLALAAFEGGLAARENAAQYVLQGVVPCAVARSTELSAIPQGERTLRPLLPPLPAGGEARYGAELMGFVILDGADTETAARFAAWLLRGPGLETACAAGLVPYADAGPGEGRTTPLGELLTELSESGALVWPDAEDPFYQNRDACERELCQALDLLG